MDNKEEFITIKDASRIYNLNINTLYKYIQQGKIKVENHTIRGRKIQRLTKSEIEEFLGIDIQQHTTKYNQTVTRKNETLQQNTIYNNEKQNNTTPNKEQQRNTTTYNELTKDSIREVIEEFFSSKQAELVKPMEEMALYRLGGLEKENLFLKERLETVLNEYKELQDKMKALPDLQKEKEDIEVRLIQEKEEIESRLQREKSELETRLKSEAEEAQRKQEELEAKLKQEEVEKARLRAKTEAEKADIEARLLQEKEELKIKLKQEEEEKAKVIAQAEKEKADVETRLKAQAEEEKAALEVRLKAEAEEEKKQIAEAWKKELELAKKPWWRFW